MRTLFWLEILKGCDHSEHIDVDVRIILEGVLKEQGGTVWAGLEFLDQLSCFSFTELVLS
jgi:hypothetical protein